MIVPTIYTSEFDQSCVQDRFLVVGHTKHINPLQPQFFTLLVQDRLFTWPYICAAIHKSNFDRKTLLFSTLQGLWKRTINDKTNLLFMKIFPKPKNNPFRVKNHLNPFKKFVNDSCSGWLIIPNMFSISPICSTILLFF